MNANFNSLVFLELLRKYNLREEQLFNPYLNTCPFNDIRQAPMIRMNNLIEYFKILPQTNTLLIGEAPGYLGCRRTGIAFTDEHIISEIPKIFNMDLQLGKATFRGKDRENSATWMWQELIGLVKPPFLWNIIPFHPFEKGKELTNRTPITKDFELTEQITKYFLKNTSFERIFAIGKISQTYLKKLGFEVDYIRHPSYGGFADFRTGIQKNFEYKPVKQFNKLEKWL